ncbi:MAG: hypothetical protein Q9168_006533 [Polycauliona sp. 1 TL-2023]
MYLRLLGLSLCFWQLAAGQTPTSSFAGPSPTCLQPRKLTDPSPSAILSALASTIPKACDQQQQKSVTYQSQFIRTYHVKSYNFNISQDVATQVVPARSDCLSVFQNIVSACVDKPSGAGFWGGWVLQNALNYSLTDAEYPRNALLSPAASGTHGSSVLPDSEGSGRPSSGVEGTASGNPANTGTGPADTSFPSAGNAETNSGSAPTGSNSIGSDPEETGGLDPDPEETGLSPIGSTSGGGAANTKSQGTPDFPQETGSSTGDSDISGPLVTNTRSGTSQAGSEATPTNFPIPSGSNLPVDSSGVNAGTGDPSSEPSGFVPTETGPAGTGTGFTSNSASGAATSNGNRGPSGKPAASSGSSEGGTGSFGGGTGPPTAIRSTSAASSRDTGTPLPSDSFSDQPSGDQSSHGGAGPSNPNTSDAEASSTGDPSDPGHPADSGNPGNTATRDDSEPSATRPGTGPITPPPAIPTTAIKRDSPEASSQGIIVGGLLSRLSNSAKSYSTDITIPATKTAFLDDIDDTEHELETLFVDLGGKLPPDTGGCSSGGARKQKRGPLDFVGDVFNSVRCAINSVSTLKGHVDIPKPDFPTIEGDLGDIGTLAQNIDNPDDNNDDDSSTVDEDSSTEDEDSSTEDEDSTNEPSTQDQSSQISSSQQPSSASASTTGSSSSTGDTCGSCCPTDVPALPTDGTPAVTAPPSDPDALEKRVVAPGRLHRHIKRRPDAPIPKINGCNLQTPNNWPVTTPAYPGGFEFYTSDTQGQLGTLTTISRYYRSTTVGSPACTPTITKIDAARWTFSQSGNVPENDKVSVDHAYEIGFLKSFMESVIDKPNGITCKDANAQFFDQGTCPDNRMEPIFGSLPSYKNPDFIAMSQWLNGDAKGWVLGPTYDPQLGGANLPGAKVRPFDDWKTAMNKVKNKMRFAQILVEAALIMNADNTIPAMQTTNNRIYAAFKTYDTFLSQNGGLARSNFGWAAKYKTYMDQYVNYRNGASSKLLGPLLTTVQSDLNTAKNIQNKVQLELDQWTNLHRSMTTYYTGSGGGVSELNWSIKWEWNAGSVKRTISKHRKRQDDPLNNPTGHCNCYDNEPTKTTDSKATPTEEAPEGCTDGGTGQKVLKVG